MNRWRRQIDSVGVRGAVAAALCAACACFGTSTIIAQDPARGTAQPSGRGASASPAARGATTARRKPDANLAQLMRGIVYPSSNVVFAAQGDLNQYPPAKDPATSPNLLTSAYGGWQAVESAALRS